MAHLSAALLALLLCLALLSTHASAQGVQWDIQKRQEEPIVSSPAPASPSDRVEDGDGDVPPDTVPTTTSPTVTTPSPTTTSDKTPTTSEDPTTTTDTLTEPSTTTESSTTSETSSSTSEEPTSTETSSEPKTYTSALVSTSQRTVVILTTYVDDGSTSVGSLTTSHPVTLTTGFLTATDPAQFADGDENGSSGGMSDSTKSTIGGVVGGLGGAILIGGILVVWWRLRRRKNEPDYDDYKPVTDEGSPQPRPSLSSTNALSDGLERYGTKPKPSVNTSSNF